MMTPEPFAAFDAGWTDPAAPAELHPHLRGEGGVAVARWLVAHGVQPAETADVAAVLQAYVSGWAPEVDPAMLLHVLRGAVGQPGTVSSPALSTLLQQALARVHGPDELRAMIEFFRRTAVVQTLHAGSGPMP
jgi:hypothetical protein